jgi:hypothetical protein
MARRARVGICTYCSSEREVTEDHIIPQCLWTGRVPKKVPKVPACRQCNHILKSELDTYLRDLLITDRRAAPSPIVQNLHSRYVRSVLTNKSRMGRDYRERGTVIAKVSPSVLTSCLEGLESSQKKALNVYDFYVILVENRYKFK